MYWSQKFSKIYLLDSRFQISQNIHLNFSSHYKVEIKPWRNNSLSTLVCNRNFSMTFSGIKEVLVQSIQSKECGKSSPLIYINTEGWPIMLVHISDIIFSQTGQSSLQIVCKTHELLIVNSTFIGGRNGVDISIIGTVLKAILMGTTFSHNRIGSLITHGMLNKSSLDIQNCTFSNNVVTDSSIQLFSLHSIVIMFSCFERNFADTIIKVENVINMSISDTFFHSNVVQTGSVVILDLMYCPHFLSLIIILSVTIPLSSLMMEYCQSNVYKVFLEIAFFGEMKFMEVL